jgi:hypothetical protein
MTYRDDLEAAQHHIGVLEEKLRRAEAEKEAALAPRRRARNRSLLVWLTAAAVVVVGGAIVSTALLVLRSRAVPPPPSPIAFTPKNADPTAAEEAPRAVKPPPAKPDWSRGACKPVVGCYVQSHYDGRVDGLLTVTIGADGHASKAAYTGSASPAVRKCLVEAGKGTAFEGYEGAGGKLTCKYQGEVFGGSSQLFSSSDFVEATPDAGADR